MRKKDEFADLMVQKLRNLKWEMVWIKIHYLDLYCKERLEGVEKLVEVTKKGWKSSIERQKSRKF